MTNEKDQKVTQQEQTPSTAPQQYTARQLPQTDLSDLSYSAGTPLIEEQTQSTALQQHIAQKLQTTDLSDLGDSVELSPMAIDTEKRLQALRYAWSRPQMGLLQPVIGEEGEHFKIYLNAVEAIRKQLTALEGEYISACDKGKLELGRPKSKAERSFKRSKLLSSHFYRLCQVKPGNFKQSSGDPLKMVHQVAQHAKEQGEKLLGQIDAWAADGLFRLVLELYNAAKEYTHQYNTFKKTTDDFKDCISPRAMKAGEEQADLLDKHFAYRGFFDMSTLSVEETTDELAKAINQWEHQAELKIFIEQVLMAGQPFQYEGGASGSIKESWKNLIAEFLSYYGSSRAKILAAMFEARVNYAIRKKKVPADRERQLLDLAVALKSNNFLAILENPIFKGKSFEILAFIKKSIADGGLQQDGLEEYFPNLSGDTKAEDVLANNLRIWKQYKALPTDLLSAKAYPNLSSKLKEFRKFFVERCQQFSQSESDSLAKLSSDLWQKIDVLFKYESDALEPLRKAICCWLNQPFLGSDSMPPKGAPHHTQKQWLEAQQKDYLASLDALLSPVGEVMNQVFSGSEFDLGEKQKFFQDLAISTGPREFVLDDSVDGQVLKQANIFLQCVDLQAEKKSAERMESRLAREAKALIAKGEGVAQKARGLSSFIEGAIKEGARDGQDASRSLSYVASKLQEMSSRLLSIRTPAELAREESESAIKALTSEISQHATQIATVAILRFANEHDVPCEVVSQATEKTLEYVYFAEEKHLYRFPVARGELLRINAKEGTVYFQAGKVYQVGSNVLISQPSLVERKKKNQDLSIPDAFNITLEKGEGEQTVLVFPKIRQVCKEVTLGETQGYEARRHCVHFFLEGKYYQVRNNNSGKGFEFELANGQKVCLKAGSTYDISHPFNALPFSIEVAQAPELKRHDFEVLAKHGYEKEAAQKQQYASYFNSPSFEQNTFLLAHILAGIAQVDVDKYEDAAEKEDVAQALTIVHEIASGFSKGSITYQQVLSELFDRLTSKESHTESRKIYATTLKSFLKGLAVCEKLPESLALSDFTSKEVEELQELSKRHAHNISSDMPELLRKLTNINLNDVRYKQLVFTSREVKALQELLCQNDRRELSKKFEICKAEYILDGIIDFKYTSLQRLLGGLVDGVKGGKKEFSNILEGAEAVTVKQAIELQGAPADSKWHMPEIQFEDLSLKYREIENGLIEAEAAFKDLIARAKNWFEARRPEEKELLYFLRQWQEFAVIASHLKQKVEEMKKLPDHQGLPERERQVLMDSFAIRAASLERRIDEFKASAEETFARMTSQCLEYSHLLVDGAQSGDGLYQYFAGLCHQQNIRELEVFSEHLPYLEYPFLSSKSRQDLVQFWLGGSNAGSDPLTQKTYSIVQTFIKHEMRDPRFAAEFEGEREAKIGKLGSDYISAAKSYIASWGHSSADGQWSAYQSAYARIQDSLKLIDDEVQHKNISLALGCFNRLLERIKSNEISKTEAHTKQIGMVFDAVAKIFSFEGGLPNVINTLDEVRQQIKKSFTIRDPYKNDALFRFCDDEIPGLNTQYRDFVASYRAKNNKIIDGLLSDNAAVNLEGLWSLVQETHADRKPPVLLFGENIAKTLAARVIKNERNIINQAGGDVEPWTSFINYLIRYEKDGNNIKSLVELTKSLKSASKEQAHKYFRAIDDAFKAVNQRSPASLVSDPENPDSQIKAEEVVHQIGHYLLNLSESYYPKLIKLVFESNNYAAVNALYAGLKQAHAKNPEEKLFKKVEGYLKAAFNQQLVDIKRDPGKYFDTITYLITDPTAVLTWSDKTDVARIYADLRAAFGSLLRNEYVLSDRRGELSIIKRLLECKNFERLLCMEGVSRNQFFKDYSRQLEKFYKAWVIKLLSTKVTEGTQQAQDIKDVINSGIKLEIAPDEPYGGSIVRDWIREALLEGKFDEGVRGANLPIIMQEKVMMASIIHHINLGKYFHPSAQLNKYIFQYASSEKQEEYVRKCLLKMNELGLEQAQQFMNCFSTLLKYNKDFVFNGLRSILAPYSVLWNSLFSEYNRDHNEYSAEYLQKRLILSKFCHLCSREEQELFMEQEEADKWANEVLAKLETLNSDNVDQFTFPQVLAADKGRYLSRALQRELQTKLKAIQASVDAKLKEDMIKAWGASDMLQASEAVNTLQPFYTFLAQMAGPLGLPQGTTVSEAIEQPRFSGTSFAEAVRAIYSQLCSDLGNIAKLQDNQALQALLTAGSAEQLAWLVFILDTTARQKLVASLEAAKLSRFGENHPATVIGNILTQALKASNEADIFKFFDAARITALKTAYAQMNVLQNFAAIPKSYKLLTETTAEQFEAMKAPSFQAFRKNIVETLVSKACDWRTEDESVTGPISGFVQQVKTFMQSLGDTESMQKIGQVECAQIARAAAARAIKHLDKLCVDPKIDEFLRDYGTVLPSASPVADAGKAEAGLAAQQAEILKNFKAYLLQITIPLNAAFESLKEHYHSLESNAQSQVKSDLQKALHVALEKITIYLNNLLDAEIKADINPIGQAVFDNLLVIASGIYRLLESAGLTAEQAQARRDLFFKAVRYLQSNTAVLSSPVFVGTEQPDSVRNLKEAQCEFQSKRLVAAYEYVAGLIPIRDANKALGNLKSNLKTLASYCIRHSVVKMAEAAPCVFRYNSYQALASKVRDTARGGALLESELSKTFPNAATFSASERDGDRFKTDVSGGYIAESHAFRLVQRIKAYLQIVDKPAGKSYQAVVMNLEQEVRDPTPAQLLKKLQEKFLETPQRTRAEERANNFIEDLIKFRQQQAELDYKGLPPLLFNQLEEEITCLYDYLQHLQTQDAAREDLIRIYKERIYNLDYAEKQHDLKPGSEGWLLREKLKVELVDAGKEKQRAAAKTPIEKEQDYILWLVERGSMREALIAVQPITTLQPNVCDTQNEFYRKLHEILNRKLGALLQSKEASLRDVQLALQIVFAMQPDSSGVLKEFWVKLRPLIITRLIHSPVGSPDFKFLTDSKNGLLAMLETEKAAKLLGEEQTWVKKAFFEQDKQCALKIETWLTELVSLSFMILNSPEPVLEDKLLEERVDALMPIRSFSMQTLPAALASIETVCNASSKMTPAIRNLLAHICALNNKYASKPVDSELTIELKRIKGDLAILMEETKANREVEAIKSKLFSSLLSYLYKLGLKPQGLKSLEEIPVCRAVLASCRDGRELTEEEGENFESWVYKMQSKNLQDSFLLTLRLYKVVDECAKDSTPKKTTALLDCLADIKQDEFVKKDKTFQMITAEAQQALSKVYMRLPEGLLELDKLPLSPVMPVMKPLSPVTPLPRTMSSKTFASVQSQDSLVSAGGSYTVGDRAGHEYDSDSEVESQGGAGSQSRTPSPVQEAASQAQTQADQTERLEPVEQTVVSVTAGR
ncbi:MAG: hypothetical protein K0S08_1920 [Gammaproteobacteria bacterium]|jgi:hypothetical protein|nr:hypothetical protein [Gammaproteobacteria bacterium]